MIIPVFFVISDVGVELRPLLQGAVGLDLSMMTTDNRRVSAAFIIAGAQRFALVSAQLDDPCRSYENLDPSMTGDGADTQVRDISIFKLALRSTASATMGIASLHNSQG